MNNGVNGMENQVIERVLGKLGNFDLKEKKLEPIVLTREAMRHGHGVLATEHNRRIKVSLPENECLRDADVLYADDAQIIYVLAAPEDVLTIYPTDTREWARVCYNIGNMHMKIYLNPDSIDTLYDHVLETQLISMEASYTRYKKQIKGEDLSVGGLRHRHGS
ncbi:MAG: hypothetical protein LBT32_09525 [Peptococcaceae bacterium]|jgi:urease accessory protein|nr:hypothetical protein [Peptococcaceae bacterium]